MESQITDNQQNINSYKNSPEKRSSKMLSQGSKKSTRSHQKALYHDFYKNANE